ncbi:receptor-like protein 12 [Amborella trichopoda]|uniref:receptor-like protein 12 n=1 Tax=Amborella trichopoda TaxID=13333 RepID=UPI0009BD62EE|nr:receptor-like protein 12 [Amborella trichopoda]|eukprot:XP_020525978.1 receptor-like protein 12 [Amborella trichopoda]
MASWFSCRKPSVPFLVFMISILYMFLLGSPQCLEKEVAALLEFKASLVHPNKSTEAEAIRFLDSWKGLDCCAWNGVTCCDMDYTKCDSTSSMANRVVGLEVFSRSDFGRGDLNVSSLVRIEHLQSLILEDCNMGGFLPIKELSKLKKLQGLNLKSNFFAGTLPVDIGLLSSLKYLNLHGNELTGTIPSSLKNLSHLVNLDLSNNKIFDKMPPWFGSLPSLIILGLSNNKLQGSIPHSLGNLSSLVELSLRDNHLTGSIPQEISKLESLERLDISNNSLSGYFSFSTLSNISHLDIVSLSHNRGLVILQGSEFDPSFQISELRLSYCDMSKFDLSTSFLSTQQSLVNVYFSYSKLLGSIPSWLLRLTGGTLVMDGNMLSGPLVSPQAPAGLYNLDISYNNYSGEMPKDFLKSLPQLGSLDISHNFLTGDISSILTSFPRLSFLDMSFNKFYGRLPSHMTGDFWSLDLSNNKISGNLPPNLTRTDTLGYLNLSNNSLDGPLLSTNFNLTRIQSIHLDHNAFHGTIPKNLLLYSPLLMVMDIGANYMSGLIPREIAEITSIQVLILKENRFEGNIPDEICRLQRLAILDLSENNFEGSIPSCFHNNFAWINGSTSSRGDPLHVGQESGYVEVVNFNKGNEYGYSGIVLSVLTGIDLSLNHLSGPIPLEIGLLKALIVLNISNNHLNGTIPDSFSELSQIEALDLSHNGLKGRIPSELGSLTFLSQFSVAYNDLEGAVPFVNNFRTFEESSYSGNPKLCGYTGKECSQLPKGDEEDEEKISRWVGDKPVLYACIATGFIVGFWGVLWFLFLSQKWRFVWFKAIDGLIHHVFWGHE